MASRRDRISVVKGGLLRVPCSLLVELSGLRVVVGNLAESMCLPLMIVCGVQGPVRGRRMGG
jgi:hypothetical protein